jgi:hypothetical protein
MYVGNRILYVSLEISIRKVKMNITKMYSIHPALCLSSDKHFSFFRLRYEMAPSSPRGRVEK